MSIKSKIENHSAIRLDLAGRIAAIGDRKLSQFFTAETEALEALKAEALSIASPEENEQVPALKLPARFKTKAVDQEQSEGESNEDSV